MAFDLNPVAVTAAPLLRAIKAGNWNTRSELADAAGRKRSNIARDLAILVNADLIEERTDDACGRPVILTDDGEAQLAALDRAANPDAAGGGLTALHADLEPHPLNPRKDFETAEAEEALDELRVSIVKSGLLQPIVVRPQPTPGKWWIVAGERRWRAIGQAVSDGDWDEDQPLPITIRDVDDRDHLLLALNENLQRSNMKAIEEGVAFNAAVQDFGLSTEELANRTGKSQRYVQQRIALLKLDPVDQDRMRLNRDHPDYLSFKAARILTQTPRAPDAAPQPPAADISASVAEYGAATLAREPGSPPEASPPAEDTADAFGHALSDRAALAFVELVDRVERFPAADPELAALGYTEAADAISQNPIAGILVTKGAIGIRYRGGQRPHARAYLTSTGARAWLEQIGFYAHREDVLFEMRARVFDLVRATEAKAEGHYLTAWLNPSEAQSAEADVRDDAFQAEPEQPELIEATEDEKAARTAQKEERERAAAVVTYLEKLSGRLSEWCAQERAAGRTDWLSAAIGTWPHSTAETPSWEAVAVAAVQALAVGDGIKAIAAIALLESRLGYPGRRLRVFGEMSSALIAEVVDDARAPAPKPDAV